jgi:nucleotide-binding universal stress UspA family protein
MKVLICSDCSPAGEYILREAHKFLAGFPDAEIHILSAIDMAVVSVAGMYDNTEEVKMLEKQAQEVGKWAQQIFTGKEIHFSTELGNPAEVILQQAGKIKAGLLIMGTQGKTGFNRMLLGSVAENVLRHTSCNTMIIPVKHVKNE